MKLAPKSLYLVYSTILPLLAALQFFTVAVAGQDVEIRIEVDDVTRTATVFGRFTEGFGPKPESLSFRREAAGFPSLATRIRDLKVFDPSGDPVAVRRLMDGEYLVSASYGAWSYSVELNPPKDRAGYAHASWIDDGTGVLMFDDLLPEAVTRMQPFAGSLTIKLPEGWNLHSASRSSLTHDLSRSVAFIGKSHRSIKIGGHVDLLISGEWHFTDTEAAGMVREIFDEYSKMLGDLPKRPYLIALQRFPAPAPPGQWEAETRGRTVTIFSSDMPFRTQSLQRLHEQLRHEIFHLWIPNGIAVDGDYTWFYEGFAMYMSLKLAVKLNRIRFDDFLDTLARAYTIDANARPRRALTDRGIDPTVRYARGMIIAFLADVELLRNTGGKIDVTRKLRDLFEQPRVPNGLPADVAVKNVVSDPVLIDRYVEAGDAIDWAASLATAGIEAQQQGRSTVLSVVAKRGRRERAILDRLGYNNWRKSGKRK